MKEKFVALHMPSNSAGGTKSTSIWRRWNRLTACQKRSLIVVLVLLVTTYAVGEQLHELHLKSKKIEKIKHKKHKNPKHKDNYNDPTDDNDPMYEEQPSYDGYAAEEKDDTESDFVKPEDDQYQIPNEDEIHQKPLEENINGIKIFSLGLKSLSIFIQSKIKHKMAQSIKITVPKVGEVMALNQLNNLR